MSFLPPTPAGASGGDSPGSYPLTIGQVQFNSIECPEELPIGAVEQRVADIELLGGGKIVQALGVEPKDVTWKGTIWGQNVIPRVQQLRSYVVTGQTYVVQWNQESWTAVVKEFSPNYKHIWRCEYTITLDIINSNSGGLTNPAFPSVDSQVDGINDEIQDQVNNFISSQLAVGFGPVSIAWQDYLIALGLLYEAQQIF